MIVGKDPLTFPCKLQKLHPHYQTTIYNLFWVSVLSNSESILFCFECVAISHCNQSPRNQFSGTFSNCKHSFINYLILPVILFVAFEFWNLQFLESSIYGTWNCSWQRWLRPCFIYEHFKIVLGLCGEGFDPRKSSIDAYAIKEYCIKLWGTYKKAQWF